MYTKKILILLLLFYLFSCKSKSHADFISSEYNKYKASPEGKVDSIVFPKYGYVAYLDYDTTGRLYKIEGVLKNKKYGHFFKLNIFDKLPPKNFSGALTQYYFQLDNGRHYSYEIKFNFQDNKYYESGSPFVDYIIDTPSLKDSVNTYTLLFSTFPRKEIEVLYSFDDLTYKMAELQESRMMPFLYETKITSEANKVCYIKTKSRNMVFNMKNILNEKEIKDTLPAL